MINKDVQEGKVQNLFKNCCITLQVNFFWLQLKTISPPLKPDTNKRFISTPWHHQLMMTDKVFLWRFDFSILFFVASLDPISFAYLWSCMLNLYPVWMCYKNMKQLKVHMTRMSLRFIYLQTTVQTLKQQSAWFFFFKAREYL